MQPLPWVNTVIFMPTLGWSACFLLHCNDTHKLHQPQGEHHKEHVHHLHEVVHELFARFHIPKHSLFEIRKVSWWIESRFFAIEGSQTSSLEVNCCPHSALNLDIIFFSES